jgi:hypothetical protein
MKRWFWIVDALVVIAFVVVGREDHGFTSDGWDYLRVASPFLLGLGVTILALRGRIDPTKWRAGIILALGTVLVGMLLRRWVWDDGTARTFIMVTTGFMVAAMIGWRIIASGIRRIVASRSVSAT